MEVIEINGLTHPVLRTAENGAAIIAEKGYSQLPIHSHLTIVLAVNRNKEYVTWTVNRSIPGEHYGNYWGKDYSKAYEDFVGR